VANQLQVFENKEFGKVRVVEVDGQPWFVGNDVCVALGYQNPRKALIDHVDGEDRNTVTIRDGIKGNPNKTLINESGLYSLILSSKLPTARKFKRWVTSEVLPSIRRHGVYVTEEILDEILHSQEFAFDLFKKLAEERQKTAALETLAEELAPKAIYCDLILQCKNAISVSVIARDYGMTAVAFNRLLHSLRIQFRVSGTWLLYQEHTGKGYTKTTTYRVDKRVSAVHTRWTQAGRLFLYETLKSYGYLPLMESQQTVLH
jgi:prophage antirepressor-like protein